MMGLFIVLPVPANKGADMSDQNYNDPIHSSEQDLDDLIRETRSEIDVINDIPAPAEEFRDQEYQDTFDEYFEQAFDLEEPAPLEYAVPVSEEEPEHKRKRPNIFQRRRERRRRKRKDSIAMSIFGNIIYFVLIAAAAILIAKYAWLCADDVLALTKQDSPASVAIEEGDNLEKITKKLHDAGLIEYPWLFKLYGEYSHVEDKVRPGVYELNTMFDYHALVNGMQGTYNRMTTTVTIIEGKTSREIFEQLDEAGVCSFDDLAKAAAEAEFDYEFLEDLEYGNMYRLDGYLFPDTYEFYLADDAEDVIDKFLRNFDNRMDDTMMAKVSMSGYSLHEILAIASIIQEEAAAVEENELIASVIYNRLNSESLRLLQMDSTVFYAAERMDTEFDTGLDSPYNTYAYPGIPAGPIDNPGMAAIEAALEPEDTNYYYFAYGKDGLSHFYSDWDSFEQFLASDEYIGADDE